MKNAKGAIPKAGKVKSGNTGGVSGTGGISGPSEVRMKANEVTLSSGTNTAENRMLSFGRTVVGGSAGSKKKKKKPDKKVRSKVVRQQQKAQQSKVKDTAKSAVRKARTA